MMTTVPITNYLRVWKYTWPLPAMTAAFDMPAEAEILCAREQGDNLCIWACVVEGRRIERRHFIACMTGHEAPDPQCTYIGTVLLRGGALVLHVFETTAVLQ
jgi:hypothetical protein